MTLAVVHTPELVLRAVAKMRDSGGKIVLANGAFDLLHVGHLRYLKAARALGAMLVVAVNSDASVRRAKGALRPIVPLEERLELLSNLRCVDALWPFDAQTVSEVIEQVRPDIHAKGTDYSVETVPERRVVEAHGGCVHIVGDPKNHATSHIVATLRGLTDAGKKL